MEEESEDKLLHEIMDEKLTPDERRQLMHRFFATHAYGKGDVLACGACGLREHQRHTVKYKRVCLQDPGIQTCLLYDEGDRFRFYRHKEVIVDVPVDQYGNRKSIEVWKASSAFQSEHDPNMIYHLHPELVDKDDSGSESTNLCHRCWTDLKKFEIPKLSIANGIDFGNYQQLGLEQPNLHEQAIIARVRRYMQVVKIKPNSGGQTNFTMNKIQAHAILFEHDAPYVAESCFSRTGLSNPFCLAKRQGRSPCTSHSWSQHYCCS